MYKLCLCFLYIQSKSYIFNVHGAKSSSNSLQLLGNEFDIIVIQEYWLYPDELPYLSSWSNNIYNSFIVSPMNNEDKLHSERPYRGVGIMWNNLCLIV